jgi:hypothetical protein
VPCSATNDLNIVQAAQLSQEIFSLAACPARLLFQLDPPVYWAVLGVRLPSIAQHAACNFIPSSVRD